jgi:hypothetical protein
MEPIFGNGDDYYWIVFIENPVVEIASILCAQIINLCAIGFASNIADGSDSTGC